MFGQGRDGIMRVSSDGGEPEVLIARETGEREFHGPQLLPGGTAMIFTVGDGLNLDEAQIVVRSLETGEETVLIEGGRDARYVATGHLLYVLDGTLLAVPFDVDALEVTGGPITMVEGIRTTNTTGAVHFSVSDTGSLIFVADSDQQDRTVVWVDRNGKEEPLLAEPRDYRLPRLSPDGRILHEAVNWTFAHAR